MQLSSILFLAGAASVIASPVPEARKPEHGVCHVWAQLTEYTPAVNTPHLDIEVRILDGKGVEIQNPVWFNGKPIGEKQRLIYPSGWFNDKTGKNPLSPEEDARLANGTVSLHNIINPDSELKISWAYAGKRITFPNGKLDAQMTNALQFEYTLHRGGTDKATIMFNDLPDLDWGFARCRRVDKEWIASAPGIGRSDRIRRVRCDFNC
ncbi:hypothetical protein CC86DRAFT_454675 [Ophiobolus disseminans]|uniref:Uncharacterized protein n=1 Tax=Ophiobolus disseminans TaxID=1469910 RepID=A0A6A7A3R5_9PLEO|nr:hypothetical protein CC86DRAFT_454675 [Ophiobolus disseminans]